MKDVKILLTSLITALLICACAALTWAGPQERGVRVTGKRIDNRSRFALVIGNGGYRSAPLKTPVNDARAMAASLRRLGFRVVEKTNLNYVQMNEAVEEFGRELKRGGIGLFFYTGHGLQIDGSNYLIPVDADIRNENEIRYKAVDSGLVLAKMERSRVDVSIVILDASRETPFASSLRSISRGLANMDAPIGSFIAYATTPGTVAPDETGTVGLFTSELVKEIEKPGLKLEDLFKHVITGVRHKSRNRQVPYTTSSLEGNFWFTAKTSDAVSKENAEKQRLLQERVSREAEKARKAAQRTKKEKERAQREVELRRLKERQEAESRAQKERERKKREQEEAAKEIAPPDPAPIFVKDVPSGHRGEIKTIAFSYDGTYFATGGTDDLVVLWNAGDWTPVTTLKGHRGDVNAVRFSKDGRFLASGSSDDTIIIWDVQERKEMRRLKVEDTVNAVSFSPDSKLVACGCDSKTIIVWDIKSGAKLVTLKGKDDVFALEFSPTANILAAAGNDNLLQVWDVATANLLNTLMGHDGDIHAVAFDTTGRFLISGGADKKIIYWDVVTGFREKVLEGHEEGIRTLSVTPNGNRLVSWDGRRENGIIIWDTQNDRLRTRIESPAEPTAVAVSPDGNTLILGCQKRLVVKRIE